MAEVIRDPDGIHSTIITRDGSIRIGTVLPDGARLAVASMPNGPSAAFEGRTALAAAQAAARQLRAWRG